MIGIYCIKNLKTNKMYIGQSVNIKRRVKNHFDSMKKGTHENSTMQNDFNEHGIESFVKGVVELLGVNQINNKEVFYIKKYNTTKCGYNKEVPMFKEYSFNESEIISLYDIKTMDLLAIFPSIESASLVTNIKRESILKCAEYRKPKHNNYIFLKESDTIENYIYTWSKLNDPIYRAGKKLNAWRDNCMKAAKINRKPIMQLDLNEVVVREYEYSKQACELNEGFNYKGLYKALSGERLTYKGFKWKYKE